MWTRGSLFRYETQLRTFVRPSPSHPTLKENQKQSPLFVRVANFFVRTEEWLWGFLNARRSMKITYGFQRRDILPGFRRKPKNSERRNPSIAAAPPTGTIVDSRDVNEFRFYYDSEILELFAEYSLVIISRAKR